jgi:hypothetical protein
MAFLIYPLADFLQDYEGAGPLKQEHNGPSKNRAAERDSVSDAKISNGPLIWWLYPMFGHAGAR